MSAAVTDAALAIAAVLFNSLWQGALIAGGVWLGLRCLPKLGAATRYAIWLCTLAALVLVPVATVYLSAQQPSEAPTSATVAGEQPTASAAASVPLRIDTAQVNPQTPEIASEPAAAPPPDASRKSHITVPQSLAVVAALVWLLAACVRGLKLVLDIRALDAIRREARLWPAGHDVPVFVSHRVDVPLAAGLLRAAIILPASLVERLRPDALETIVIHEVAHVRRYDVWTNAFARIVEALVALNPVAWFVMRRLSIEREIACDDWVVARTGSGDAFATVLAGLATRVTSRAPIAAASALGSRHSVVVRIERLLDAAPRRLRLSPSALGGALMLLALFAFMLQSVSPVLAYEPAQQQQQQQPVPVLAQAPAAPAGAKCAVPNHGIRWPWPGRLMLIDSAGRPHYSARGHARMLPMEPFELRSARDIVRRAGAAHTAIVDLTVDATGRTQKAVVVPPSRYPGIADDIVHIAMINRFDPATRNCVPITSTVRTGWVFGPAHAGTQSSVDPAYPKGWSTQYASACKVPSLIHTGVPAFPGSMKSIPVGKRYNTSVRVHVNAAGAVTNAAVVASSGEQAFDSAVLAAARQATYPLTESSGFKPVRPSGTSLAWNATHGSSAYTQCKPLPADYVWNTTFARQAPFTLPGMAMDAMRWPRGTL